MTEQHIETTNDLLDYLVRQMDSGARDWFGYPQQKVIGVVLAYEIAMRHADILTPDEVVDYVASLNNAIYAKLICRRDG